MSRQETPSQDYLHRCRELHIRVTKARYGRQWDLQSIEDAAKDIRSTGQLTYEGIEKIRAENVWNANVFGYFPPRAEVEPALNSIKWGNWNLRNLRKSEKTVISSLLQVFRQIELVSVILRFIVPEEYGILSPPVEKVLGLGPFRNHTDRYRAYLKSLRKLKNDKGFATVADVDMALWVLQVGVLDEYLLKDGFPEGEHEKLQEGFSKDSRLREVRVENLTKQLFSDLSRTELAEALLETDSNLAGKIAGIHFEKFVRLLTNARSEDNLRNLVHHKLPSLILAHYSDRRRSKAIIAKCKEARRIRNLAIHLDPEPKKDEVRQLIKAMKEVDKMWKSRSRR